MLEAAVLVVFPILMVFAAWSDLLTMTISNRVSIALVAGYLIVSLLEGTPAAVVLLHLSCGAGVLGLTFALFCAGWIGGGDAKLAAGTAVWIGWGHLLEFGLVTAMLGGVLTVALLAVRTLPLPQVLIRQSWIARLHDQTSGVPYGIALGVAGLLLYPETQIWLSAVGT